MKVIDLNTLVPVPTPSPTPVIYFDMMLDEARGWIYGSDSTGNKIDVISTTTRELVKSFTLVNGATPKGIALSPDGSELAVAQNGSSSILFINPDTGATIATVIPNVPNSRLPWDVVYGRNGRLYSSGNPGGGGIDYIHVINTATHTEISRSSLIVGSTPYLAISSDKNSLFVNEVGSPNHLYKLNVSTDTLVTLLSADDNPVNGFSANYLLLTDNSRLFTETGQVWSSDSAAKLGSLGVSGYLVEIPGQNMVAVISKTTPGLVTFVKTTDYYPASTYTIVSAGTAGPGVASSDGTKLYVNTLAGMKVIDLNTLVPVSATHPTPVVYFEMALDEARGWIYGSDSTGNKIDVISTTTRELVKSFTLVNGATPKGIALSPDGSELAVAQNGASSILFINPDTGATIATIIPNVSNPKMPWDVVYGRNGRLYSSGNPGSAGSDYIHVINTTTHTEISRSSSTIRNTPYLAISSDKNSLYANDIGLPNHLYKFNVSTDSIPTPTETGQTSGFSAANYLLLADNSKVFTDQGQVWSSDLNTRLGSFGATGYLAEIPGQNMVAVISKKLPGLITFVRTTNYSTASTYTFISTGSAAGPGVVTSDGGKLFINTLNGVKVADLQALVSLYSGSPQSVEVLKPFSTPFNVLVKDINGNPISGMEITFTAPENGASGAFSDNGLYFSTATTNINGLATSSTFIANNVPGSYTVKATAPGLASFVGFQLTNLPRLVISGNAGVEGAILSYIDGSPKTVTADGNGNYSFTVPYNWTGTVTPSKTGYTFSPSSKNYTRVTFDQASENYAAQANTYTISGSAGIAGATLTYSGGSTIADGNGFYSFMIPAGWMGTITPSKTGYTFTPASISITTPVAADLPNQNFTAVLNTYTISGNVGVAGTVLTYTGGSTIADGNGDYAFTVLHGWTGTVTPSKMGYSFLPTSKSYTNVASNKTVQNYTAILTISGNAGVASAILAYTGGSTTADSNGNYSFDVSYNWAGTVTPYRTGFTFSPASRSYANIPGNQTTQNYVARAVPAIAHVKLNGLATSGCGETWAEACDLQYALSNAISGNELWVAAGIYKPTTGTDRSTTFQLKNGVAVYGGFAGTETKRDQRDFINNLTILSGDLNSDDAGFINNSENVYHVVIGSSNAILDGFTITAGNANGSSYPNNVGGGIYNNYSSPALTNVTFRSNSAGWGGGMYNYGNNPTLTNVVFSSNSASSEGGGMYNEYSSSPVLTNVTFSSNSATNGGGGMYNYYYSSPVLMNVTLSNNTAHYDGGGIYNDYNSSPVLTNVTFSGNSASSGGGMFNLINSNPALTNVTFSGNLASSQGGAMYNQWGDNPQIRNTIFWGNTAPGGGAQIYDEDNSAYSTSSILNDSVVQGGCPQRSTCTNIITTDPKLGAFGNYTCPGGQCQGGGFIQTISLLAGSSAIDSGNDATCPATDQRGVTRPQGAHCDIGAYEVEYHTISGALGANGAGATITYTGGSSAADSNGYYSFTVLHGWSGTVTASKTGYTFSPASKDYVNVIVNQTDQNYTATPNIYTISGNAGVAGATITYTGGSTTANGNGDYFFTVTYGWSGSVTPSKTGYIFSPASKDYANITANQNGQDYTVTLNTYTVSGNVGVAGATINYSGGSTTVDVNGDYSFMVSYGWSGTVTPSKVGYTFSPVSKEYANVASDQAGQNYTTALNTYTVSGNAGVAGATVAYTGGSTTADTNGDYSFTVSYGWSGTVTPSKTGYIFSPSSKTYTDVSADQIQGFTATIITYTIFGSLGTNGAGAIVTYNSGSITANSSGDYAFSVPYNWSGTVTPSKTGVLFSPTSRDYSNVTSDQTNQNYQTALLPGAFAKISPLDKASGVSTGPTLTWNTSLGAVSYEYCIDTTNNDICDGSLWRNIGIKTNIPLRGLTYAQNYYWQVRAINAIGTTYANGGSWYSFSTQPGAFNKVSPLNKSTTSISPTLSWAASMGATTYEYCIDTTSGATCDGTWTSVGNVTNIAIGPLSPSTTYYWQVRSIFADGYAYANNAWWSFTTSNGFPGAFAKSTPANRSSRQSTSQILTWTVSPNATSYRYCIDTVNNNICDSSWVSTGTSISAAPTGLLNGKTYYWQVQAVNAYGITEANSRVWWYFSTQPGNFNKSTPQNASKGMGRTYTLTWSASEGATSYEYCYDTTANNICDGGKWMNAGPARSVTLTFRSGYSYNWQVRAVYSTGSTLTKGYVYADSTSAWWKFTTIP
jgi:hypothetical protein